jgi:hypothetical protein
MLSIPSNLENLWMSEGELVDMLHVTAPKLNSVIRAIYKEGTLSMSEVQQRQETSKGIWQTLYVYSYSYEPLLAFYQVITLSTISCCSKLLLRR